MCAGLNGDGIVLSSSGLFTVCIMVTTLIKYSHTFWVATAQRVWIIDVIVRRLFYFACGFFIQTMQVYSNDVLTALKCLFRDIFHTQAETYQMFADAVSHSHVFKLVISWSGGERSADVKQNTRIVVSVFISTCAEWTAASTIT